MGSRERPDGTLADTLKAAYSPLAKLTDREIASWIVARLHFITSGTLESEGKVFSGDTNQFGYKIKLSDDEGTTLAHGAVVFSPDRVYFAGLDIKVANFQQLFIDLLVDSPTDLSKCEIVVRESETKKRWVYGWDGYTLLKW